MKMYEGLEIYIYVFLTSSVVEGDDQLHALAALLPEKEPPVFIG
jgi:hypothetical protein